MKKTAFAILAAVACTASPSYADGPTRAPGSYFRVEAAKARALMNALEASGVKTMSPMDATLLNVQSVDCTAGFLNGRGSFSACKVEVLVSVGPMTPAFRHVFLETRGKKARALINALEDAGIKSSSFIENASYQTGTIRCTDAFFPGHSGVGCTIEVPHSAE